MKIIKDTFQPSKTYNFNNIYDSEDIVFFDIETSGFTARSSNVYLIGCAYQKEGSYNYIQWFAETPNEEKEILISFFSFIKDYKVIIHFNGSMFDMPYVMDKCKRHALLYSFDSFESIDLLKEIRPYKTILNLPNCKQKTVEMLIGLNRDDIFTGGQLIPVYEDYQYTRDERALKALTLHNAEDIMGMVDIASTLIYSDIFKKNMYSISNLNYTPSEFIATATLNNIAPANVTYNITDFTVLIRKNKLKIIVKGTDNIFKNYYTNYKDYYFLIYEDSVIHKSLATYVDKNCKKKATKDTCYSKFAIDQDFIDNSDAVSSYIKKILNYIL